MITGLDHPLGYTRLVPWGLIKHENVHHQFSKKRCLTVNVLNGSIFCIQCICKLFGVNQDSSLANEGFCDWKNCHKGEELANITLKFLEQECGLSIKKCRGQSYDNAANMSGKYNGMQQKILEQCKHAVFIPCAAHSLNLVGRSAVDSCIFAVNFFSIVQAIYRFFVSSTHRWTVLKRNTTDKNVVKSLSETRWEAHAAATSALLKSYDEIINALLEIADDSTQKGDTIKEASNLADKMQEFEFVFMLCLWCQILNNFRNTSQALQAETLNLSTCSRLYMSLSELTSSYREKFDEIENEAKNLLPDCDYNKAATTRKIRRKKMPNDGLIVN